MLGLSGLDLQDELLKRGFSIPIIFITGHGTVSMSVRAMKSGAVDFIQKPFENQDLLDVVHQAIEKNKYANKQHDEVIKTENDLKTLTRRENEILDFVIDGSLNKEIASRFQMSESTVKTHRRHIMQKMGVDTLAELVRIIERLRAHKQ